jgi:hypothetical protein
MWLPKMTTRRWMVAVAVVGISLTAARLVYLWRHYRALAAMHASKDVNYVRQAQGYERKRDWCVQQATIANEKSDSVRANTWERGATSSGATARDLRQLAAFESRLKSKYERAAAHPWLPVEPDSPGPPEP